MNENLLTHLERFFVVNDLRGSVLGFALFVFDFHHIVALYFFFFFFFNVCIFFFFLFLVVYIFLSHLELFFVVYYLCVSFLVFSLFLFDFHHIVAHHFSFLIILNDCIIFHVTC